MKRLLLAFALISISFSTNATTTIDQMTTGPGSLVGTEELPFLYPGNTTSYKTTAQQIANLSSGAASPAGAQGNTQINGGSGHLGAQADFWASAFGAVCDGAIVPQGVETTNGSPVIIFQAGGTPNGSNPQFIPSPANVGDTIVLANPAQLNTGTAPITYFTSTVIASQGGDPANSLRLASNVTFTSTGYTFASAWLYKTVNTTALQNALNAGFATGNGGHIHWPLGVCATAGLTFYPFQTLTGEGFASSVLMQANGVNGNVLTSYNFSAQIGQPGINGGAVGWTMEDFGLDGNKGANTGSNSGQYSATGDLLKFYGAAFFMNRMSFANSAADEIYSAWTGSNGGDPLNILFSEDLYPTNLVFANAGGWAWVYDGPHDGWITNSMFTNCGTGCILQHGNSGGAPNTDGGPLHMSNIHMYQCGSTYCMDGFFGVTMENSSLENSSKFESFLNTIIGTSFGTIVTTTGFYEETFIGDYICTLDNRSAGADGFHDVWIGGTIAADFPGCSSGGVKGSYIPSYSYGVRGGWSLSGVDTLNTLGYNAFNGGQSYISISRNTDWPFQMTTFGNVFSMYNGQGTYLGATTSAGFSSAFLTASLNQHVAIGPLGAVTTAVDAVDTYGGAVGLFGTTTTDVPNVGYYAPATNTLAWTTSALPSIEVNAFGHEIVAGATPSVASGAAACGTSPSIAGTDNSGVVVTGTSPSGSCVVTFANPWTNAPDSCGCTNNTSAARGCSALSISTTSFALVATTSPHTGGDSLGYGCKSHRF